MIRNVSLLRIRKEWIQPAVARNNFSRYSSCLTTLLIFTAIFELQAWIKRSILSGWLNCNTNRTCIVLVHRDKSRQNCNTTSLARLAMFYFSIRYLISRLIFTWPVWSSILEPTVQNTKKDQQIGNIIRSRVILSPGYRRYCGSFLWKWIKNIPFLDISFLFLTKNPNDPDFWSDLGF